MAKSIKALKCPQCGSTQKTEVRPDLFRCESCGTEYFLDNDDININYTERKIAPAAPAPTRPGLIVGIVLGVLVLLFVLPRLFRSSPSSSSSYSVGTGSAGTDDNDDEGPSGKFSWSSTQEYLYLNNERQPVLFMAGSRRYERATRRYLGTDTDSCFASFYDAGTGQELKSVPLTELNGKKLDNLALKAFENGDLYLVANKTLIYQIDNSAYTVKDVTGTLFKGQPELSAGVASIEPVGDDNGDGFSLFTNDGRTVFFFPRTGKVYGKDAYYEAQGGLNARQPGSATKSTFVFSSKSSSYPEDKLQLLSYQYKNNDGGPKDDPRFSWRDDYGGSGMFTDADPHEKVLITPYSMRRARVLSFKDFTPGRLYFSPQVLYSDADRILIRFRPTAADGSAPVAQLLDAKTGAIKFTTPLPTNFDAEQAIHYAGGFALRDNRATVLLSNTGTFRKPVSKE